MSDIEAEVSTLPSANAEPGTFEAFNAAFRNPTHWPDGRPIHAAAPDPVDEVVASIAEVAAADNARRLEQMRRVRRAAVNRLIDFVRIEQLGLNGPNDRTSVEELTHDAIMKALDLYFEGRPKASPDSMSMAIDTLERIQGIKPNGEE